MSTNTGIEWTEATWNPVVGCTRVSAGCDHCYAVRQSYRLEAIGQKPYKGLTVLNANGDRHFKGVVRCLPERLEEPLHWRKPRRIFVNSMSDLFHEKVPSSFVADVLRIIERTPRHTYQVLTKRPERMADLMTVFGAVLPNLHLGTSVENQEAADERIPHLLRCPAAVRFLSVEPMLGPVDLLGHFVHPWKVPLTKEAADGMRPIHWVIVGGESGPGARPCDVEWSRSIIAQCKAAGVPCFVKQLGALPYVDLSPEPAATLARKHGIGPLVAEVWQLNDSKGGDPAEWPEDLRVREWPK